MKTIVAILLLLLAGCAGLRGGAGVPAAPHVIESGDALAVVLRNIEPTAEIRDVVDRQGQIALPFLPDRVWVVGLTPDQAEQWIKELYADAGYYLDVRVVVRAPGEAGPLSPEASAQEVPGDPREFSSEYRWERRLPETMDYWTPQDMQVWEWRTGERFPAPNGSTYQIQILPRRPDAIRAGGDVEQSLEHRPQPPAPR
jgi:hypothetical protein